MTVRFPTVEMSDPAFERDGLRFMTVRSPALGRRADLCCFVPQEELPPDALLVILLHGVYGSHWCWAMKGAAHLTAAAMIACGALPPCVIAMPSDGLWGDGSGYVTHQDADYERWIVEEVPAAAALLAPRIGPASRVCVAGSSMGGFGALRLAAAHPSKYLAASALSAITNERDLDYFSADRRSGWRSAAHYRSLADLLADAGDNLPALRFDCGTEDELLPANRELHSALTTAGIAHVFEALPGDHSWRYWSDNLRRTLAFFGIAFRAA